MLEWLAETVKENTHKRWDKNINDMYTHIQNHIFINLIPALDRLSIATNTIRGHALFHEGTDRFVSAQPFKSLMDDIDSMRLLAQKLQLVVMTEQRQFRAFSKWVRVMIDIGVAGLGSKAANEIEERELPNLDYSLLLSYIKDTLTRSRLTPHLEPEQTPEVTPRDSEPGSVYTADAGELNREKVVKALESLDIPGNDNDKDVKFLLNLSALKARLLIGTFRAVSSITQWQSGTLPKPSTIPLTRAFYIGPDPRILDLRLYPRGQGRNDVDAVTELLVARPPSDWNNRTILDRISRPHSEDSPDSNYCLPSGEVLHAKILNEQRCLVLFKRSEDSHCYLISCDLPEYPHVDWFQVFERDPNFKPNRFIVGGRQGKMVCVVFADHGHHWKVLDFSGKLTVATMEDDEMVI